MYATFFNDESTEYIQFIVKYNKYNKYDNKYLLIRHTLSRVCVSYCRDSKTKAKLLPSDILYATCSVVYMVLYTHHATASDRPNKPHAPLPRLPHVYNSVGQPHMHSRIYSRRRHLLKHRIFLPRLGGGGGGDAVSDTGAPTSCTTLARRTHAHSRMHNSGAHMCGS